MDTTIHPSIWKRARSSGSLNLTSKNLTVLPKEVFTLPDCLYPDEKIWECTDLLRMDLSYNLLSSIDDSFQAVFTLKNLVLLHNKLTSLPPSLFELKELKLLDLSHNLLASIPEEISNLSSIVELNISNNNLKSLPSSFLKIGATLEILRLNDNVLDALPLLNESFGLHLTKLIELNLTANNLRELPKDIGLIASLKILEVGSNKLKSTPESFKRLTCLTRLDLRCNTLTDTPFLPTGEALNALYFSNNYLDSLITSRICAAKGLTILDLKGNKLASLPDDIAQLKSLQTLDVSNNDLTNFPPSLGYIKSLNRIILDGNPIRSIRMSIIAGGTESLKKYLRTRGPDYTGKEEDGIATDDSSIGSALRVAKSSGKLALIGPLFLSKDSNLEDIIEKCVSESASFSLQILELEGLKLNIIPETIGNLNCLKRLSLNNNALEFLPLSVTILPNLTHLSVKGNRLSSVLLEKLNFANPLSPSLVELDLSCNSLSIIPSWIYYFRHSLKMLDLSYNMIKNGSLDEKILSSLQVIYHLNLSSNLISIIPKAIYIHLHKTLTYLSLENNSISIIPYELGYCKQLVSLNINGNPQKSIRANIATRPTPALLEYLQNKLPEMEAISSHPPLVDESISYPLEKLPTTSTNFNNYKRDNQSEKPLKNVQNNFNNIMVEPPSQANNTMDMIKLKMEIQTIENDLENKVLTTFKSNELKKQLRRLR